MKTNAATPEEVESFLTPEGSKAVFNLNFPLLVPVEGAFTNSRYYTAPLTIRGRKYRMTSQWYETQKGPLQKWINEHGGND